MRKINLIVLLAMATVFAAVAQPSLYTEGNITIQSAGILYVGGDVEIANSASVLNDGTIEVKGNFRNDRANGDVTSGTSGERVVKFTGTSVQQINSTSGKASFHNVEVQTTASFIGPIYDDGGVVCNVDVTVDSILNMNGGDIILGDNDLIIGDEGEINNYSPSNLLVFGSNGRLVRKLSTNKPYVFPIYRDSVAYLKATVDLASAASGSDRIAGQFIPQANLGSIYHVGQCFNTFPGNPSQYVMLNKMVDNFGYWEFEPFDGTDTYNGDEAGWDYDMTLHVPQAVVTGMSGSDYYKIVKVPSRDLAGDPIVFNPSTADWSGNVVNSGDYCSGIVEIANYVEASGITATNLKTFSDFGGAGNEGGAGLPVELIYLDAKAVDNKAIDVLWTTATEVNNMGFEVERSLDGTTFETIGWVYGNGTTSEEHSYSYRDKKVTVNQRYYYRLKQIDLDGGYEYTGIVSEILVGRGTFAISDFMPNPAVNGTSIEISTDVERELNITFYNTIGQMLMSSDYRVDAGVQRLDFDFSDVANGTYFAIIMADGKPINKKLVITK